MSRTALMARLLDHVAAEPEMEAQHRWKRIERAANEFRRAYRFNADSMAIATAHARSLIVNEHPGYRYVRTTEVSA